MRRRRYLTLLGGGIGAAQSMREVAGSVLRSDALESRLRRRNNRYLSSIGVAPEPELTVEPETQVLFEVASDDLGPYGGLTNWYLDGDHAGHSMGPWYAEYYAWESADYWTATFESTGSYAVEAVGEGATETWDITVESGGIAGPMIEGANPDPETTALPADAAMDLELEVTAPDGSLDRVVWWLAHADIILGVSDVSGSQDTATVAYDGGCHLCPIVVWVIDEHNVLTERTLWTIEGYESEATEVSVVRANDPVWAGEFLEVEVEVRNPGSASTTEDVSLVVGGEQVDETTVSIDGNDVETVTLGYETYPVQVDVAFPVTVSTSDDVAHHQVTVVAADSSSLAIDILETRDPVVAGEFLEVIAAVENLRDEKISTDLALEAGQVADTKTVSLWPGQRKVVSMGYHTYPVTVDVEFPVKIHGGGTWDARPVRVFAAGTAHLSVRITETNAPVAAGDPLVVIADIWNRGTTTVTENVALVAGHTADTQTVRIPAGETVTVRLEYDTHPVQRDVRFPIEVSAGRGWDQRLVQVFAHALPLSIEIVATNDPVTAGDILDVYARVHNPGATTVTRDVHLVSAGQWVDTQTVTVDPGDTITVPLQYRTPLVTDHVQVPIVVETRWTRVSGYVDILADHIPIICRLLGTNAPIRPGQPLLLTVELVNETDTSVSEDLVFFVEGDQMETATISLEAGATETLELEAPIDGDRNPEVTATVEVGLAELTQSVALQAAEADLSVEIDETPSSVEPDDPFEVSAAVENLGDAEVSDDVLLTIDGSEADITSVTVEAGDTETIDLEGELDRQYTEEVRIVVALEDVYDETTLEVEAVEADIDIDFESCTRATVSGVLDDGDDIHANTMFVQDGLIGTTEGEDGIVVGEDVEAPFEGTIVFEVGEERGVSGDDEEATVTVEDRGDFGTAITGLSRPGSVPGAAETNPEDCEGAVTPEEPSVTVEAVSPNTDSLEVTFGYENPNDATIEYGGEFVEGTTDDEPPADLEPGAAEVVVEWTPTDGTEVLAWELDLTGVGLEDSVRAETDPAEEYLDAESVTVEIVEVPDSVAPGDALEVTAELENPGALEATVDVTLVLDDAEADTAEVTVAAAETETVDLEGDVDDDIDEAEMAVLVEAGDETDETTIDVEAALEEPLLTVEDVTPNTDSLEVTFGYENPNDMAIEEGGAFVEGTTDDEPPSELEPGSGQVAVDWTPTEETEVLVWEIDLSDFGLEEPVRAETDPYEAYLEAEPLAVVSIEAPESVEPGASFDVAADLENPGDLERTEEVTLLLDGGEEDVTSVTVGGGETETVELQATVDEAVDAETMTVTVETEADAAEASVEILAEGELLITNVGVDQTIDAGATLTVSADLENTGGTELTQDVTLLIDGQQEDSEGVSVGPEGTASVSLSYETQPAQADSVLTVTVETMDDAVEETVEVLLEEEPEDEPEEEEPEPDPEDDEEEPPDEEPPEDEPDEEEPPEEEPPEDEPDEEEPPEEEPPEDEPDEEEPPEEEPPEDEPDEEQSDQ